MHGMSLTLSGIGQENTKSISSNFVEYRLPDVLDMVR